jgi:hypothetical protein
MAGALVWDAAGKRVYETGVSKAVLYVMDNAGAYPKGVAWNGLTGFTESPSGAEATPLYADNTKYLNLISAEEFGATLEAYTYPDEFAECDGSAAATVGVMLGQQSRKTFGLSFETVLGNDVLGEAYGTKIHLVYGCLAAPSEKAFATINDSPEAITFSWTLTTTPANATGFKPVSLITIDSTKVDPTKLAAFLKTLRGDTATEAQLPLPDEVIAALTAV